MKFESFVRRFFFVWQSTFEFEKKFVANTNIMKFSRRAFFTRKILTFDFFRFLFLVYFLFANHWFFFRISVAIMITFFEFFFASQYFVQIWNIFFIFCFIWKFNVFDQDFCTFNFIKKSCCVLSWYAFLIWSTIGNIDLTL